MASSCCRSGHDLRAWVQAVADEGVSVRFVEPGRLPAALEFSRRAGAGSRLVHTHFTRFDIAAAACRSRGARVVWHLHTRPRRDWPNLHERAGKFGVLGRRVSRVLCAGEQIRGDAVVRGAPRHRVHVVPNGIDLERFRPGTPDKRIAARMALGLPAKGRVLLHLGHDPYQKGTDRVLDSRSATWSTQRCWWSRRRPASRCSERGVQNLDAVADMRPLDLAADALIAPSRAEGGDPPFALAEALACGTPVIASDIPGHRALAGLAPAVRLSAASPQMLAEDVLAWLPRAGDPAFARAHAGPAPNFSVERYARDILRHYDEIVAG